MIHQDDIFDLKLIKKFQYRACCKKNADEGGADFLLRYLGIDLAERLQFIKRQFSHAVDIHAHTSLITDLLRQSGKVGDITRCDPALRHGENLSLAPRGADLIVSIGALHLTNDTPGLLVQIRQALQADGLFIAAFAGHGTLVELRESLMQAESELYGGVSPRIIPFMDVREAGALMQRTGFALPVTDSQQLQVRYKDVFALMRDLRMMGMQNALHARPRRPVSKRFFARLNEIYARRFADADGRIRATFSFIWLTGWAPHPAQQKPLQPGSATHRLEGALRQL